MSVRGSIRFSSVYFLVASALHRRPACSVVAARSSFSLCSGQLHYHRQSPSQTLCSPATLRRPAPTSFWASLASYITLTYRSLCRAYGSRRLSSLDRHRLALNPRFSFAIPLWPSSYGRSRRWRHHRSHLSSSSKYPVRYTRLLPCSCPILINPGLQNPRRSGPLRPPLLSPAGRRRPDPLRSPCRSES